MSDVFVTQKTRGSEGCVCVFFFFGIFPVVPEQTSRKVRGQMLDKNLKSRNPEGPKIKKNRDFERD